MSDPFGIRVCGWLRQKWPTGPEPQQYSCGPVVRVKLVRRMTELA